VSQTRPHAHRLEIFPGDVHVRVSHDGVELADSRRPVVLKEGKLPTRYYLPRSDVRMELLTATDSASHCPFKGDASYWTVEGVADAAWTYETPIAGAEPIAGLICFYSEKVDVEVDGESLVPPGEPRALTE
jgi:uncharacterized protein (DUF427 family)